MDDTNDKTSTALNSCYEHVKMYKEKFEQYKEGNENFKNNKLSQNYRDEKNLNENFN